MLQRLLVDTAIAFAREAHHGQVRKGPSARPYITHPLDVVERLRMAGVCDPVTLSAAALHDVVEDCGVKYGDLLMAGFPAEVVEVVWELTDPPGMSKRKAKERQVFMGQRYSRTACLIKLADKASNLNDVAENPPGWTREAELGYAKSCAEVVAALKHTTPELLSEFWTAYARVVVA